LEIGAPLRVHPTEQRYFPPFVRTSTSL
jgi:hypothetical protein